MLRESQTKYRTKYSGEVRILTSGEADLKLELLLSTLDEYEVLKLRKGILRFN